MTHITEIRVMGLQMFNTLRIVPVNSFDSVSLLYQIDEMVTNTEYITWTEKFATPERALFFIAELAKAKGDSICYDS